jgi:AraC-like DNA-binding protein
MTISMFAPSKALARFVKCYYYLENTDSKMMTDTFFADGCVEAVFSIGWDFYKGNDREDWAKVIGQILKPRSLKVVGRGQSFGIWFYPHTFPRFAKVQMFELNDRVVSWDALFPGSFSDFVGDCLSEKQLDKLVDGVDNFLIKKMSMHNEQSVDKLTEAAVRYLYQNKSESDLNRLALMLNVSQRYLQKAFATRVGFSQKMFIRMLRFQQVLQQMRQPEVSDLTTIAYECDYYDQSHFVREFKSFTGIPPSLFHIGRLPISQHFMVSD